MKKDFSHLDPYRIEEGVMGTQRDGSRKGAFIIQVADQRKETVLMVVASDGCDDNGLPIPDQTLAWEHVSVHTRYDAGTPNRPNLKMRLPTWPEMQLVKTLFWEDDERVMQFHPEEDQYVNDHPFVLHLWKPGPTVLDRLYDEGGEFPWPNSILVGLIPEGAQGTAPPERPQEDVIPIAKKGETLQRGDTDIKV